MTAMVSNGLTKSLFPQSRDLRLELCQKGSTNLDDPDGQPPGSSSS